MLEHYFVKPSTLDRIRGSWLASPIERYVEWLETHGYTRATVVGRVPLLFQFAEFAKKNSCTDIGAVGAYVEAFVSEWLSQHGAGLKTSASLRKQKKKSRERGASNAAARLRRHCKAQSALPGISSQIGSSGVRRLLAKRARAE